VRAASAAVLVLAACSATATVDDLDGVAHAPLVVRGARAHVLVFLATDCPIANAYAPVLRDLREACANEPVRFFLVHVDPGLDAAAARRHAAEFGLAGPILVDGDHALARAVGASVTPEAAVIGSAGRVLYRGRIDDWFGDVGKKRPGPTRHDLRDAIAAVLAGRPVAEPRTQAVGCPIE
jgi:hypothetical protein